MSLQPEIPGLDLTARTERVDPKSYVLAVYPCDCPVANDSPWPRVRILVATTPVAQVGEAMRWVMRHTGQPVSGDLINSGSLVERLLQARGLVEAEYGSFLDPCLSQLEDPFLLQDMDVAADRLSRAIRNRESIMIFGDYDADGTTATALLVRLIRFLNGVVDYYIPHRVEEGYGLNVGALKSMAAMGVQLVVTVDTGISAIEAAEQARELGLDLIITDHHQPGPRLPDALAVVNPNRADCPSPTPGLAGVGVAFKLAHAVLKTMEPSPGEARAFLGSVLELVAIGSVADFAPLTGENRVLARHGLQRMTRTQSVGLKALMRVAAVGAPGRSISASEIGFQIGPRINAAGRTGDARICVELLTTEDPHRADAIALELEARNRERRRIESRIVQECLDLLEVRPELSDGRVLVLNGPNWHPGVVGIVAARVLQQMWRPVLILSETDGMAKGSARSIPGYDIFQALSSCRDLMVKFGGHPAAAGLTVEAARIPSLREALNAHADQHMRPEDLIPMVELDAVVSPTEITEQLVADLAALEPFGQKNPEPVLAVLDVPLVQPPRVIKDKHLKLFVDNGQGGGIAAMGWNMNLDTCGLRGDVSRVDLAFQPVLNDFSGSPTVEMRIKAVRPSRRSSHERS